MFHVNMITSEGRGGERVCLLSVEKNLYFSSKNCETKFFILYISLYIFFSLYKMSNNEDSAAVSSSKNEEKSGLRTGEFQN